ncbi:MAG: hypothetical protein MUF34_35345 [Polyangiaceae bacterium]|nr:hypothetical protein [Polyangiaceae bacterium]
MKPSGTSGSSHRPLRRALTLALLAFGLLGAPSARAQDTSGRPPPQPGAAISSPTATPPRHRLLYRNTVLLRLNPTGLFNETRLGYRRRLFESESPLLRDTFAGVGLATIVSPAVAAIVPSIELQPLSILQVTASYYGNYYFGNFDFLQSFPSVSSEHSDTVRKERGDQGLNYASTIGQFTVQPLLQVKFGPIAARSATRFTYNMAHLRGSDRATYDPIYDVLIPRRGWVIGNDSDLLAITSFGLAAGVRYSMVHGLYDSDDFAPGEPKKAANKTVQRVGPIATYTFFDRPGARFNTPTILLVAQWWVDHNYRTGQDVSQAFPYFILGFSFSGDLLLTPPPRSRAARVTPPGASEIKALACGARARPAKTKAPRTAPPRRHGKRPCRPNAFPTPRRRSKRPCRPRAFPTP